MTEILLKINPFSGEIVLQRDGETIPRIAKLNSFRNRFIQQAFSLFEDVKEEYNDDVLTLALCTSPFEVLLFDAISKYGKDFQVIKRDFLINTPLQERLAALLRLLGTYHPQKKLLAPLPIRIFCPDDKLYLEIIEEFKQKYPELAKIGVFLERSKTRASVNIVQSEAEIESSPGLFSAPQDAGFKTIFMITEQDRAIRLDGDTVYWPLAPSKRYEVIKSYIDRFFVYGYLSRLLQVFPSDTCSEEDHFHLQALDKVDETVLLSFPAEIEIGTTAVIRARTFSGDPCPPLQVESTYGEIVDAEIGEHPGEILIHAMNVGKADVKVFQRGEHSPFHISNISVVNYDYATSVAILVNGKNISKHVFTPGDTAEISLQYTPENSPKTKQDVMQGKWGVSAPETIEFDQKKSIITAKQSGTGNLSIKLARVQAEVAFDVKPKAGNFLITLLNMPSGYGQEARFSAGKEKEPEYLKVLIGSVLRFRLSLQPADAFPVAPIIECTPGLQLKNDSDGVNFSITAKRIGRNETLRIHVPGVERLLVISFDVIAHPGTSDTSSAIPTYLGGAAVGAALLWLLVLFGFKFNAFYFILGAAVLTFDLIAHAKVKEDSKSSAADKKSGRLIIKLLLGLSLLALGVSFIPSKKKENTSTPQIQIRNTSNNVGIPSQVQTAKLDKELQPVMKETKGYINGVVQKLWIGQPTYDKWSYDFFSSSDNVGEFVDFGNARLGNRPLALFSPEGAYLSASLRAYTKDKGLVTSHALLKIEKAGVYKIIILHYNIPERWSCGGYAVFLDRQEVIRLQSNGYNLNDNKIYSATVKLAAGYHEFLLVNEVNWKMPRASNIAVSIKGEDMSTAQPLTVDKLFILEKYQQQTAQITRTPLAGQSLARDSELPQEVVTQMNRYKQEIVNLKREINRQKDRLQRLENRLTRSKRVPESLLQQQKTLKSSIANQEKELKLKVDQLKDLQQQMQKQ